MRASVFDRLDLHFPPTISFPTYCNNPQQKVRLEHDYNRRFSKPGKLRNVVITLKKFTALFFTVLSLLTAALLSAGQPTFAASRIVRVGYLLQPNFQEGSSGDARSGYGYEYLQEVAYHTNWQYEYVCDDFAILLDKLRRGEIELMAGVVKTPQRESQLLFSAVPCGAQEYYIYTLSGHEAVTASAPQVLNHKKVGIAPGRHQEQLFAEYCRTHGINCKLIPISSQPALQDALSTGYVDAIVSPTITRTPDRNDSFVMGPKVGRADTYFAVSRENPEILDQLNYAIRQIQSLNPFYNEENYRKYINGNTIVSALKTDAEQRFIENNPVINVGYVQGATPYCKTDVNSPDSVSGTMPEVLNRIGRSSGLKFNYVPFNSSGQLVYALRSGIVSVGVPVIGNYWAAEEQNIVITHPVATSKMSLLYHRAISSTYRELLTKVAVPEENNQYAYYVKVHYPDAEVKFYPDMEACLNALSWNEVDSVIMESDLLQNLLARNHKLSANFQHLPLPEPYQVSMAVAAGSSTLRAILNQGISTLPAVMVSDARIRALAQERNAFMVNQISPFEFGVIGSFILMLAIIMVFIYQNIAKKREDNRVLKELLADALHSADDRRNVLAAVNKTVRQHLDEIQENAALLQAPPAPDKPAALSPAAQIPLTKLKNSAAALDTILEDALKLTDIQTGELDLTREVVDLDQLLHRIVSDAEQIGAARRVTIDTSIQLLHQRVYSSPEHLEFLLRQLLTTAVLFTKAGQTANFAASELTEDMAAQDSGFAFFRFTIADGSNGLTDVQLRHILHPEFPLTALNEDHTYTSRLTNLVAIHLAEIMNGRLAIASNLGEGTTFTVTIPLDLAPEDLSERKEADR